MLPRSSAPFWSAAAALALLLTARPATALVIFNDTFDAPNYAAFWFNASDSGSNPDDVSFAEFNDAGGVGEIAHFHELDRDEFGEPFGGDGNVDVQSFFVQQSFTWTPSVDGVISDIGFMIDVQNEEFGSEGGFFFDVFFQISSVGGGSFAAFTNVNLEPGFQTIMVDGLTNAEFGAVDFAGSDPLEFGFGFISTSDVFFGDEQISLLVDNFKVSINEVPEPSALALLGLGAALLVRRTR